MRAKPIKCYIGNYDGRRDGMIFATSKREAATVARCSAYHFERYWSMHSSPFTAICKALTLYTRKSDYHSDWHEGICQL